MNIELRNHGGMTGEYRVNLTIFRTGEQTR